MPEVKTTTVETALRNAGVDDSTRVAVMGEVNAAVAPLPDTWVYRIVVAALGVALFVPLFAMIGQETAAGAKELGQLLLPISTGALGALAGCSPLSRREELNPAA